VKGPHNITHSRGGNNVYYSNTQIRILQIKLKVFIG